MPMRINNSTTEDDVSFTEWTAELGMSHPSKLYHHLCQAYRDGRVLILDRPTQQALIEATRETTLREARRVARNEARNLLFEMGYTPK